MIPKSGYRFSEKIMLQELRLQVEGETDAEGVERFLQIDAHAARGEPVQLEAAAELPVQRVVSPKVLV